ncbi:MAG TPA: hypothetical protein VFN23_01155 [Ktedonobacteraceae bacterium]|nr:hypothetical protein [Ktedonobacteraceae bacterium]
MAENMNPLEFLKGLSLSRGAMLGAAATVPMTAFMIAAYRFLAEEQRAALPGKLVVDDMLAQDREHANGQSNLNVSLNDGQKLSAALTSHFAFGASMGSLYSGVAGRWPLNKMPGVLKGGMFGAGVWGAGYLGWVPGMKIAPSAGEDTVQHNALMVAAHIVWGATLGILDEKF